MIGWRNRTRTDFIVIHSSQTTQDQKDRHGNPIGFRYLYEKHRDQGAFDIGYHWVVLRDGVAITGRPEAAIGNHAPGFNQISVGVCLIGGKDQGNLVSDYTDEQWTTLRQIVETLLRKYPGAKVVGHQNVAHRSTLCPGFDVRNWWAQVTFRNKENTNAQEAQAPKPEDPHPTSPSVN